MCRRCHWRARSRSRTRRSTSRLSHVLRATAPGVWPAHHHYFGRAASTRAARACRRRTSLIMNRPDLRRRSRRRPRRRPPRGGGSGGRPSFASRCESALQGFVYWRSFGRRRAISAARLARRSGRMALNSSCTLWRGLRSLRDRARSRSKSRVI